MAQQPHEDRAGSRLLLLQLMDDRIQPLAGARLGRIHCKRVIDVHAQLSSLGNIGLCQCLAIGVILKDYGNVMLVQHPVGIQRAETPLAVIVRHDPEIPWVMLDQLGCCRTPSNHRHLLLFEYRRRLD